MRGNPIGRAAVVRPRVVLFQETLHAEVVQSLYALSDRDFDVVFAIGTTAVFAYIRQPILRAARNGVPTIEINPACTEISDVCRYRIPLGAAEAMTRIWARARGEDSLA